MGPKLSWGLWWDRGLSAWVALHHFGPLSWLLALAILGFASRGSTKTERGCTKLSEAPKVLASRA